VVAAAVRARQRVPSSALKLDVEGRELVLRPHVVAAAQARARRGGKPHNVARVGYVRELLDHLVSQYARVLGVRLDAENRRELLADLRAAKDVRREVNLSWMPLTPQRLLEDLYAEPRLLREAAPLFAEAELDALYRPRGSAWTISDVPLLDEAAELLGEEESTSEQARLAAAERRAAIEYARGALQLSGAGAFVSAEQLADRFGDGGPLLSTAERAIADRTWAYGHVVVDEAQELSAMAWRMLMRRCPTKSMTLVGDVAQTGSAAGAQSWASVLGPHVGDRWQLAELTVNYRTPGQVMRLATAVLRGAGIDAPAPTSAREGDFPPVAQAIPSDDAVALVAGVRAEVDVLGGGKLAVISAASQTDAVYVALAEGLPAGSVGRGANSLDATVAVLSVTEAKGLEFDAVALVEPARIMRESPRGANDLYVAITRPTQRLRVLHSEPLPAGFESIRSA
jgi:DNA helicase IV